MYSNTLDALVDKLGQLYIGDYWAGSVSATSTSTTIVDSTRQEEDDYFNNRKAWVYIRTGTYKGSTRPVADFVNSTYTISWTTALGGAPAVGDQYALHGNYFRRAQIVQAINQAIERARESALVFKTDTSVVLAGSTYEYPVPAGFAFIHRITMANGDGEWDGEDPIPPDQWSIVYDNGARIRFHRFPQEMKYEGHEYTGNWADVDLTTGRTLRIEGMGYQSLLVNDADICRMSPFYVLPQAASFLYTNIAPATINGVNSRERAADWKKDADGALATVENTPLPFGSRKVV